MCVLTNKRRVDLLTLAESLQLLRLMCPGEPHVTRLYCSVIDRLALQMLDRNRFSDSQLKKAANKFDTMRREGSLKLIKPNGRLIPCVVFWVKVAHESMGAQTGQSASAAYRSNGKSSAGASSFLCARHATTHSPFLSSRSVDCRLEKDRKEFSDAMVRSPPPFFPPAHKLTSSTFVRNSARRTGRRCARSVRQRRLTRRT